MRSSSPWSKSSPNVEYVGEINEREKADFLGNAVGLLFPIDWLEPFGMVMIEAMSCGTPVIAFRCGSTEEVIDHGVSGFLVDDLSEAVAAAERIGELDRAKARAAFERRFTIERVAFDYTRVYRSLPGLRAVGRRARRNGALGPGLVAAANHLEQPIVLKRDRLTPLAASHLETPAPAQRGADGLIRAEWPRTAGRRPRRLVVKLS